MVPFHRYINRLLVNAISPGLLRCDSAGISAEALRFPKCANKPAPGVHRMKASDYITRFLTAHGVRCVFEVSGGMITHLLDSMHKEGNIRVVSVHHEQA